MTTAREKFTGLIGKAQELLRQAETVAMSANLGETNIIALRAARALACGDFYDMPISPDAEDFERLDKDLRFIAEHVDPLILSIGEAARSSCSFAMNESDVKNNFKNVIWNAIDGNALFNIEECVEEARESEAVRSDYDEHNTLNRAQQGI